MRKQIALACCGLMLALDVCVADTIPEIVSHAKQSILVIYNVGADGIAQSLGSGFFISSDGLAITNFHVINGASQIVGLSMGGTTYRVERIYFVCPHADLAVLKFSVASVPYLKLGYSPSAVEGQRVLVIGNPEGLSGTVSDGLISAFRENRSYMQITAPISPGSSGSPVLDEKGKVIGVAVSFSAEGQNLNFAIPLEKLTEEWTAAHHMPTSN
jgi:S1-C subfamily serine protease